MIGLVFLCVIPNENWLDRISALDSDGYEKHVVLDMEDEPLSKQLINKYPNITFHQIHRVFITAAGYWDLVFADRNNMKYMAQRNPCAWEKAMFLHLRYDWASVYDHVWFIEDDVMIPTRTTISNIDKESNNEDLLCAKHVSFQQDPSWCWWSHVIVPQPWYHSMVCAVRCSKELMKALHQVAFTKRKLFFLEAIFNTLAHQNNLRVKTPHQMQKIVFRHDWTDKDVGKDELVHPIKDMAQQTRIWNSFLG